MRDNITMLRAGFFPRLAAYLIDLLIVAIGLTPVRGIFSLIGLFTDLCSRNLLFQYSLREIACWAVGCFYFILLTYYTGSTLGKKLMHLKVTAEPGCSLRFIDIMYRETVGRFLSGVLCIGYLIALGPTHRALHDRLCDTAVIYDPAKFTAPAAPQPDAFPPTAVPADYSNCQY